MTASPDYVAAIEAWRAERLAKLSAEDGWLNIIGRFWFDEPAYTVGAAPDNDIVLDAGPARLARFVRQMGGTISFEPGEPGATAVLDPDDAKRKWHRAGPILIEATALNGRVSLRFRDRDAPARVDFAGIDHFDIDPDWRIVADWTPLKTPLDMEIDTIAGIPTTVTITHAASFIHDGERYELLPTHGKPEGPMFVLRDATSRTETYAASRFLIGTEITGDTIVLDFNQAVNPPCAFTDYAVCPLPPAQNVLPFRVEAGERKLA